MANWCAQLQHVLTHSCNICTKHTITDGTSQLQPQLRPQEAGQQNVQYFVRFISYKRENPVQWIIFADGEELLKAFFEQINPILTAVEPMQDTLHSSAESNLGSIQALSLKSNLEISCRTAAEQTDKDEDY